MRVDRDRVGALDAGEARGPAGQCRRRAGRTHRRRGARSTALAQTSAIACERVDRACERRPRARDDRDGHGSVGQVPLDRLHQRRRYQAVTGIHRQEAQALRAQPEQLDRSLDRVVDLLGGVDGRPCSPDAGQARAGKRTLPGRGQGGQVAHGPPLVKAPPAPRIPDELADPAKRLAFDFGGRSRVAGEIDVEARRQRIGENADLEARRADEREVARSGLCDRLVEDARRVVERVEGGRGLVRQRRREQARGRVRRAGARPAGIGRNSATPRRSARPPARRPPRGARRARGPSRSRCQSAASSAAGSFVRRRLRLESGDPRFELGDPVPQLLDLVLGRDVQLREQRSGKPAPSRSRALAIRSLPTALSLSSSARRRTRVTVLSPSCGSDLPVVRLALGTRVGRGRVFWLIRHTHLLLTVTIPPVGWPRGRARPTAHRLRAARSLRGRPTASGAQCSTAWSWTRASRSPTGASSTRSSPWAAR